jgi:hypothetical protein
MRRCAKRKKLKLSSDGDDSGSKKCKRSYDGTNGGVWRSLRLAGFWSQAVGLGWCVWQEDVFAVKMFSHLMCFIIFYNFFTFNAIFKDNAAVNCITVQYEKVHSGLDGSLHASNLIK